MNISSHASLWQAQSAALAPATKAPPVPLQQDHKTAVVKPLVAPGGSAGGQFQGPGSGNIEGNSGARGDAPNESKVASKKQVTQVQKERQALLEQQQIKELAARDREVRAHEQAHMAVGGQYAGAASYTYQRGPNGVNYAIGGEVPISTGRAATPEQTIQKAQVVRRAALAPAQPSPADRQVAASASRIEAQARRELSVEQAREAELEKSELKNSEPQQSAGPASKQAKTDKPETAEAADTVQGSDGAARPMSVEHSRSLARHYIHSSHQTGQALSQLA